MKVLRSSGCCIGILALVHATGAAQVQVRPDPPVLVDGAILNAPTAKQDPGRPVQMLESPNIDRFLFKAQDFLSREDFQGAIKILQDVVEGRTLEDPSIAPEPPDEVPKPDPNEQPSQSDEIWADWVESADNAVFSDDERLFRPVQRLCHELLASMPPEGVALYRSMFEVTAERKLAEARYVRDYEDVFTTWFMTFASAKAMSSAADLLMDQGTFRAAIQTYRHLLDVYPAEGRARAGIADDYVRFKIALCFRMLGDARKATQALQELANDEPDSSIRLMGELQPLAALPGSEMFRANTAASEAARETGIRAFRGSDETLVPLWEHRYVESRPVPEQPR